MIEEFIKGKLFQSFRPTFTISDAEYGSDKKRYTYTFENGMVVSSVYPKPDSLTVAQITYTLPFKGNTEVYIYPMPSNIKLLTYLTNLQLSHYNSNYKRHR